MNTANVLIAKIVNAAKENTYRISKKTTEKFDFFIDVSKDISIYVYNYDLDGLGIGIHNKRKRRSILFPLEEDFDKWKEVDLDYLVSKMTDILNNKECFAIIDEKIQLNFGIFSHWSEGQELLSLKEIIRLYDSLES